MKGKGLGKRCAGWIQALFAVALIILAGLTLHDMQTAEGTGLYLAIKAGAQDRRMYDLAVDGAGMLCLLGLLLLPCLLLKRLNTASFLRFLSACLAFLPVASTARLVHLADGTEEIGLRQAIAEGRLGAALLEGLGGLFPVLAAGLPVLILAFGIAHTREADAGGAESAAGKAGCPAGKGKRPLGRTLPLPWISWTMGALALILLAASLLFPALTDSCNYLIIYLLLVAAFSLWEKLHDGNPGLNAWGWILFGGFWLRAVERMLEVMSVYHL